MTKMLETLKLISSYIEPIELNDRIEFDFFKPQIWDIFSVDPEAFKFLDLRWNGELQEDWSELRKVANHDQCKASIRKKDIIENLITTDVPVDTNQHFFLTEKAYKKWLEAVSLELFDSGCCLNGENSTVIWIGFTNIDIKGDKLSIISLENQVEPIFQPLNNTLIPSSKDIKAQSHFVGQTETACEPLNYRLPRNNKACSLIQPFHDSYEKLLVVSLTKEFLGGNKVIVNGIRRLNLKLVENQHTCDLSSLELLEEVISWVYSERTQVRLLLLMDRISLDITEDCCLLPNIYKYLSTALDQAKDKYEFVIKDRKEAHAKEISDFQKDIKSATDNYSKSTNDLVTGLFKDALSAIFLLAIMLFSRLIGKEHLLDSENVRWLFKMLSIYLILTPIIRVYFEKQSLKLSLDDLKHWTDTTRNHISSKDLRTLIDSRTYPYKRMYKNATILVVLSSILLACFAWKIPDMITYSPTVPSKEIENSLGINSQASTLENILTK